MLEVKDYSKQELADAIYANNIKPESRLHHRTGDTGYTAEMVERIKYYLCID